MNLILTSGSKNVVVGRDLILIRGESSCSRHQKTGSKFILPQIDSGKYILLVKLFLLRLSGIDSNLTFKYKLGGSKGETQLELRTRDCPVKYLGADLEYVNARFLQLTLINKFPESNIAVEKTGHSLRRRVLRPGEELKLIVDNTESGEFEVRYQMVGVEFVQSKVRKLVQKLLEERGKRRESGIEVTAIKEQEEGHAEENSKRNVFAKKAFDNKFDDDDEDENYSDDETDNSKEQNGVGKDLSETQDPKAGVHAPAGKINGGKRASLKRHKHKRDSRKKSFANQHLSEEEVLTQMLENVVQTTKRFKNVLSFSQTMLMENFLEVCKFEIEGSSEVRVFEQKSFLFEYKLASKIRNEKFKFYVEIRFPASKFSILGGIKFRINDFSTEQLSLSGRLHHL